MPDATSLWPPPRYTRREDDPILHGTGPAECSSSTELSVLPAVIWDVNGYYRELGVPTNATRTQLREAYMAKDGQSSVRLTYILKQLLNPETRFEYDCAPLGEPFMDDYVRALIDRKIKDEAHRRAMRLVEEGVDVDLMDLTSFERDVLADLGIDVDLDDTPIETVDGTPSEVQDEPRPAKFAYSYYMWGISPLVGSQESAVRLVRLAEWQRQLVRALSREGVRTRFAVGLHGKPHRWVEGVIGYRTVFFLNVLEDPTEELATEVAQRIVKAAKLAPAIRGHLQHQQHPLAITTQR